MRTRVHECNTETSRWIRLYSGERRGFYCTCSVWKVKLFLIGSFWQHPKPKQWKQEKKEKKKPFIWSWERVCRGCASVCLQMCVRGYVLQFCSSLVRLAFQNRVITKLMCVCLLWRPLTATVFQLFRNTPTLLDVPHINHAFNTT